jgi:hypothetical protein
MPLTRPCWVMTTGSATAIGGPQAHASTSPSRVDRASPYGNFLAGLIMSKISFNWVIRVALGDSRRGRNVRFWMSAKPSPLKSRIPATAHSVAAERTRVLH